MIDTHTVLQRMKEIKRKAEQVKASPHLAAMYMEDIIALVDVTMNDAGWTPDSANEHAWVAKKRP
jgi:hypothetical protein